MFVENKELCYNFKKIVFTSGILDEAVDATYIIYLEGNGRYDSIRNQLEKYQPTKNIYILFNKGYKKCAKDEHIKLPAHDLVNAFLHIFKHANKSNYGNILILEDDFMFSNKIKNVSISRDICSFLNERKNEDLQYLLGCMPILQIPRTLDFKHFIILSGTGTHAVIYTKRNREKVLKTEEKKITDWDKYCNDFSKRYAYNEPICYQLFPDTDNSQNWGKDNNYIAYLRSKVFKKLLNFLKLDTQIEPGYSLFYIFSKIFGIVILFIILFIIYKICHHS
jgi:hypothetical protein